MSALLTISEYSKLRGCSVSAVYKRLKSPSNKIHNFVVIQDGQTFLNNEILAFEGLAAADPEVSTRPEATLNRSDTAPKGVEEVEEKTVEDGFGAVAIKALEAQLAIKDKMIEDLSHRLEEANRHEREISDKLAALAAQANELQRNNQLLLAQAQQPKQLEGETDAAAQPEAAPEPQKRSFWHKLFFGEY